MFEVTVGDRAGEIFGGDQSGLDVRWEGGSPVISLAGRAEEQAAHPGLGRIGGSDQKRVLRHEFGKVGGP